MKKFDVFLCLVNFLAFVTLVRSRAEFVHETDKYLKRIVIDNRNATIYVGAIDAVYMLNANLSVLNTLKTGPQPITDMCITDLICDFRNNNQILLVNKKLDNVVICGSSYYSCNICNLQLKNCVNITSEDVRVTTPKNQSHVLALITKAGHLLVSQTVNSVRLPTIALRKLSVNGALFLLSGKRNTDCISCVLKPVGAEIVIEYVSLFQAYNYTYFVTKINNKPKIAVKCNNDNNFETLLDFYINLKVPNDRKYQEVTDAHFTHLGSRFTQRLYGVKTTKQKDRAVVLMAASENSFINSSSLLFVLKLVKLERRARQTFDNCKPRRDKFQDVYWSGATVCGKMKESSEYGCSGREPLRKVIGQADQGLTVDHDAVYRSNSLITAITSKTVGGDTVIYMGTATGHVIEYWADRDIEYKKSQIDKSPIIPDMLFDADERMLYALTKNKVSRLVLSDCEQYKTCDTCSASNNPHCGWCTLKTSCLTESVCNGTWLQANGTCIAIVSVHPSDHINLLQSPPSKLTFETTKLPLLASYSCIYVIGPKKCDIPNKEAIIASYITSGTRDGPNVTCDMPREIGRGFLGSHSTKSICLQLAGSGLGALVSHKLTYFSCPNFKTCRQCVREKRECYWCIYTHSCTSVSKDCDSAATNALTCPTVISGKKVFNHVGEPTTISVYGHNFPKPKNKTDVYECITRTDVKDVTTKAKWTSSTLILCNQQKYFYHKQTPRYNATTSLMWRGNIIGEKNTLLYKCSLLTTDCTRCNVVYSTSQYSCGWCDSHGCVHSRAELCKHSVVCPAPNITSITPMVIAIGSSNTLLTISGYNLITNTSNTVVTLSKTLRCHITDFSLSVRIVCRADRSEEEISTHVRVSRDGQSTTFTEYPLKYVLPKITDVNPHLGPVSGGTLVTVTGEYLHTDSSQSVYIGSVLCQVVPKSITHKSLQCLTTSSQSPMMTNTSSLRIHNVTFNTSLPFEFVADPILISISPLKSMLSGGRNLTVTGKNFHSIQSPKIFLIPHISLAADCTPHNTHTIYCPTPAAMPTRQRRAATDGTSAMTGKLAFIMDGVMSVRDPSTYFPNISLTITYTPDPIYYNVSDVIKFESSTNKHLTIKGENLDLASTRDEVSVTIGVAPCAVKLLATTELLCSPPIDPPPHDSHSGSSHRDNDLFTLRVEVGHLEFDIGRVQYITKPVNAVVIVIPVVIISVLIIVIIVIIVIFRRKSLQRIAEVKNLEIEMEQREEGIREGVRAEFAAYNKDMSLVTENLVELGIPYRDISSFMFAVLFPAEDPVDHPLLDHTASFSSQDGLDGLDDQLKVLNQLISNRFFLIPVIRKLESCSIMAKEKAYLSSLLTLCLFQSQDTFVRILKDLMTELVSDAIDKKQTKQIMQRNETIVENLLSDWFFTSMYNDLKEQTGYSVFLLYKSVCQVTDYGPVDAVTCNAHYTLSEENMLKDVIEPKTLNIRVMYNGEEYDCTVLETDSVTQAKHKFLQTIFKNTPASNCPSAYDVDLEWRAGVAGHLPLQDFDNSCEIYGNWKRVNTLQHYNVSNGSLFALLSRQNTGDSPYYENIVMPNASPCSSEEVLLSFDKDYRIYHYIRKEAVDGENERRRISEIYLTRLISTKIALKKSIDEFFDTVFSPDNVPESVRYFFQFLDFIAAENSIDSDTTHTWKSNCLPIRIWASLVCNPQLIYDVHKPEVIEPTLLVISQCLIDACLLTPNKVSKGSPSTKLLFHRDLEVYKPKVQQFYASISRQEPVSDQSLTANLSQLARELEAGPGFNMMAVYYEIYKILARFEQQIVNELSDDIDASRLKLDDKFTDLNKRIIKLTSSSQC